MSTGIIYCAHCLVTGKKYIGQTRQEFEMRVFGHKRDSKYHDVKFYRAINKHGWDNFVWGIVEECSIKKLNEKEIFYINKYNTYYEGYNSTLGGMNAVDPINFACFKLMSPNGEIIEGKNINQFCREKKLTRSAIWMVLNKKIKSHKGWKLPETTLIGGEAISESQSKYFKVKSPEGEIIKGKNIAKFCKEQNLPYSVFLGVINGSLLSCKGWRLPETEFIGYEKYEKNFIVLSPSGNIFEGKNISKFCKENNLDDSSFRRVLSGKRKSHKGWTLPLDVPTQE